MAETENTYLINGKEYRKLEVGEEVQEGDLLKSTSGGYEKPPMTGFEVPGYHVDYYRPVNVE